MKITSVNSYAFIASVVLFVFGTRIAKVSSQAVRIFGCGSLLENTKVTLNATMDGPSVGACAGSPLTKAEFKLTRTTGQVDVICTQNVASGQCNSTRTPDGCLCKSFVNNVYTFELDFTFHTSVHAGGTLDLEPNCFPPGVYTTRTKCDNLKAVDPCENINCQSGGICEVVNGNAQCTCSGTYHTGDTCEVDPCENKTNCCVTTPPHTAHIFKESEPTIYIIVVVVLCFGNVGTLGNTIRLWWIKKIPSVICVIVSVETEEQKRKLQSADTKQKVRRFISKHFTLYCCCCCCCCCSRLSWCCSGGLIWRSKPGDDDNNVESDQRPDEDESGGAGAVASGPGCCMGCVWCLSSVDKVEVDVYCIEDKRALVLIRLESPLSWYANAEDMPAEVKDYIEKTILLQPVKSDPSKPFMGLSVGYIAGSLDACNEPPVDYPARAPKAQAKYTGHGNGQPKKSKSDKAIPLSSVGRSSPPSETSGDEKTHMIPSTKGRALPVPANQHEPTSTGIGKSASPRLDPLTRDHNKMPSVERNSGAFPRTLPSPGQPPLDPIPSGKKS